MFKVKGISDRLNMPVKSQEEIIRSSDIPEEMMDPLIRDFRSLILYNLETSGAVLTTDNQVKIYTDGQAKFEGLRTALRRASRFIHIQYYIIKNDEVFDSIVPILEDKVREGVEVRILYDGMGGSLYAETPVGGTAPRRDFSRCIFPSYFRLAEPACKLQKS